MLSLYWKLFSLFRQNIKYKFNNYKQKVPTLTFILKIRLYVYMWFISCVIVRPQNTRKDAILIILMPWTAVLYKFPSFFPLVLLSSCSLLITLTIWHYSHRPWYLFVQVSRWFFCSLHLFYGYWLFACISDFGNIMFLDLQTAWFTKNNRFTYVCILSTDSLL